MLLKCVPHVQHDYFSSFNQSDHCFLVLSLPLLSSLLKLPIGSFAALNNISVSEGVLSLLNLPTDITVRDI